MISIIITAFKEPNIDKTIKSILNNQLPKDIEIILSSPDKETIELAKKTYPKIKIFKDPGKGKAYAINLLLKQVKSDILILTDGDVFINNIAIQEILNKLKDPKIGAVSGRPIALNKKNSMINYFSNLLLDAGAHKIRLENDKKNKFIECSAYLFGIRNLIKEFPVDVAEDSIIPYIIHKKGYKISYAPKAEVYVKYPDNLKDFIKQRKRAAIGSHDKLTYYYPEFPRMKSFKNEIIKGTFWALIYPKNIKEFIWTLFLFPTRFYIWLIYYFEKIFKKKSYQDGWERIESTK